MAELPVPVSLKGGGTVPQPSKVVCLVGNYQGHVAEMGRPRPPALTLFLKPTTSLLADGGTVWVRPELGPVHHEVELVVMVGRRLSDATAAEAAAAVRAAGVLVDLSARGVQKEAAARGMPWTAGKGFDGAAPCSPLLQGPILQRLGSLELRLWRGDQLLQRGRTAAMVHTVAAALSAASAQLTLLPGDLLSTGTPAGVGPIADGETVRGELVDGAFGESDPAAETADLQQRPLPGEVVTSVSFTLTRSARR